MIAPRDVCCLAHRKNSPLRCNEIGHAARDAAAKSEESGTAIIHLGTGVHQVDDAVGGVCRPGVKQSYYQADGIDINTVDGV